jgi:hypothetical protein
MVALCQRASAAVTVVDTRIEAACIENIPAAMSALLIAGLAASSANANTMMNCGAGPNCTWGYNYVGCCVNPEVDSITSRNFYGFIMNKNSGGWIRGGFLGQSICWRNSTGADSYSTNINALGCAQFDNDYAFVQWVSGSTSYLQFQAQ